MYRGTVLQMYLRMDTQLLFVTARLVILQYSVVFVELTSAQIACCRLGGHYDSTTSLQTQLSRLELRTKKRTSEEGLGHADEANSSRG